MVFTGLSNIAFAGRTVWILLRAIRYARGEGIKEVRKTGTSSRTNVSQRGGGGISKTVIIDYIWTLSTKHPRFHPLQTPLSAVYWSWIVTVLTVGFPGKEAASRAGSIKKNHIVHRIAQACSWPSNNDDNTCEHWRCFAYSSWCFHSVSAPACM